MDETAAPTATPRAVDVFIAGVVIASVLLTGLVALIETTLGHGSVNWTLFTIIALFLLVTETRASAWLRFGDGGVVTPSWAFSFALILLGAPTGAILAMAVTTALADMLARKEVRKLLFNTAQVSLSLAIGALALSAFGVHGPVLSGGSMPTTSGIAMIVAGTLVFVTNGAVLCFLLATLDGTGFWEMLREGFALSMSADAAMLALAPILVITAQNSLLMLPLVGIATFLVYQTARQALQRAHEADHDPLTQLMNRRAFNAELTDFIEQAGPGAHGSVLILDLDRFKEINDRLGHRTGDHVLQAFAERLLDSLPSASTNVARLGGDEFAILIRDQDATAADAMANSLHEALELPLIVDGFPISAGNSIGIAHYPDHGMTPSELLHSADIAMYRAKRYRSGVETYEPYGSTRERGRVTLLADVASAVENNEYFLHYQPQVEMATGRIRAVEALLRWEHPELGRVAPGEFIGLAEQTDLIGPLTTFVVRTALDDIKRIDDQVGVAVNISARNLQDRHFPDVIQAALADAGVDPRRLELEVTESALAIEPELAAVSIERFRAMGVRISIDDFGTGYSSFATLRDLDVDRIKVDRSFIAELAISDRNRRIVQAIIDVAHGLDLDVVAEGVETPETWRELERLGCDLAQGFLVARPAPVEQLAVLLRAEPVATQSSAPHSGLVVGT